MVAGTPSVLKKSPLAKSKGRVERSIQRGGKSASTCAAAVEDPGRGGRLRERLLRTIHELVGVLLTRAGSALLVNQVSLTAQCLRLLRGPSRVRAQMQKAAIDSRRVRHFPRASEHLGLSDWSLPLHSTEETAPHDRRQGPGPHSRRRHVRHRDEGLP
jgi:hypothetical protein